MRFHPAAHDVWHTVSPVLQPPHLPPGPSTTETRSSSLAYTLEMRDPSKSGIHMFAPEVSKPQANNLRPVMLEPDFYTRQVRRGKSQLFCPYVRYRGDEGLQ